MYLADFFILSKTKYLTSYDQFVRCTILVQYITLDWFGNVDISSSLNGLFFFYLARRSNVASVRISPVQDLQFGAKLVAYLIQTSLVIPLYSILYVCDGSILCDVTIASILKKWQHILSESPYVFNVESVFWSILTKFAHGSLKLDTAAYTRCLKILSGGNISS